MKTRSWLLAGALAILVAVLVIVLGFGGDDKAPHGKGTGSATAVSVAVDPSPGPAPHLPGTGAPVNTADTPRLPTGSDTVVLPDGTRMYKVGNAMVRDHRPGPPTEPYQFTAVGSNSANLDPSRHKMNPSVIGSLKPGLTDAVAACAHDVPADGRGPHPKVAATLMLAVSKEHVTVTGSTIDLPDVVGASVEPTKLCLAEKLAQLTTTAPGEPDLVDYSITVQVPIK